MTTKQKASQPYNAHELHTRLMAALPKASNLALIFSGDIGSGKSTVLASVPHREGTIRRVFDHEDSMRYLDAGPDGTDLYTPRHQQFRMDRTVFPKLEDYAVLYETLKSGQHNYGAVVIDNIKLLQDQMVDGTLFLAKNPSKLREFYARFDAHRGLPMDKLILSWVNRPDAGFWKCVKTIFANLILLCLRQKVHFVGSTEKGNLWADYGTSRQRIEGTKAKLFDVWPQYTDAIVFLSRDPNKAGPPMGQINPAQPKFRIQGFNPTWVMDWPHFVAEIEAASRRRDEEIPEEAKVKQVIVTEESDSAPTG